MYVTISKPEKKKTKEKQRNENQPNFGLSLCRVKFSQEKDKVERESAKNKPLWG